jgi:ComF family protein
MHLDAIAYVPLAARKERERTYNQSRLLAQELGHRLQVTVAHRTLRRVRYTATQTHLHAGERAANVRGAFMVRAPSWVEGRSLLLVDDVMTTGATLRECARALKGAGAYRVFVVTVARG